MTDYPSYIRTAGAGQCPDKFSFGEKALYQWLYRIRRAFLYNHSAQYVRRDGCRHGYHDHEQPYSVLLQDDFVLHENESDNPFFLFQTLPDEFEKRFYFK